MNKPSLNLSKLAIVYARQSSLKQVEENIYSAEGQRELADRARADGFPEANVITIDDDLGLSGQTINGRPGMLRLVQLVEDGAVAAVYVEDITRLSRDRDTVDHMLIASLCRRAGVPLFMAGSWRDMADAGARMAFKFEAVGASEIWVQHLEKLRRTRKKAAEDGRVLGKAPRGYRRNREGGKRDPGHGKPIIHEGEAAVIRLFAAALLEAGSLRMAYRQTYPLHWPDGKKVDMGSMWLLLRNPFLRGVYHWGDVTIEDNHPAIIGPELAAQIDHLMNVNGEARRKPPTGPAPLLPGLVRCADCGRRMIQRGWAERHFYACHDNAPDARPAYHFSIAAVTVDADVLAALWRRLADDDLIAGILSRLRVERASVVDLAANRAAVLKSLERQMANLTDALASGELGEAARRSVLDKLNATAEALEHQRQAVPAVAAFDAEASYLESLRADPALLCLPETWDDEPMAWRRSFVRHFIERVEARQVGKTKHLRVLFRDGGEQIITYKARPGWKAGEVEALRDLMADPALPPEGAGRFPWLAERMEGLGFARTSEAIRQQVRRLTQAERSSR